MEIAVAQRVASGHVLQGLQRGLFEVGGQNVDPVDDGWKHFFLQGDLGLDIAAGVYPGMYLGKSVRQNDNAIEVYLRHAQQRFGHRSALDVFVNLTQAAVDLDQFSNIGNGQSGLIQRAVDLSDMLYPLCWYPASVVQLENLALTPNVQVTCSGDRVSK
jgi:hypothetical protein